MAALLGAGLILAACNEALPAGDTLTGDSSTTGDAADAWGPTDLLSTSPLLGIGRWFGNLDGYRSEEGGACGEGGPDAFLRVDVTVPADVRLLARGVGFQPRLHAAIYGTDAAGPVVISPCVRGVPFTWPDVPAGTELTVAVGIDPNDPALALDDAAAHQALAFAVDVAFREILPIGARCQPDARARCTTGSRCAIEPDAIFGTCERLEGDSCAVPIDVFVPGTEGVKFDPSVNSDAHEHQCTGARMRERVYRLNFDPQLASTARLQVSSRHVDIGLAARVGSCTPANEIACVPASNDAPQLDIPIGHNAAQGVPIYLFVEFGGSWGRPWDTGRKPYDLRFLVVDG